MNAYLWRSAALAAIVATAALICGDIAALPAAGDFGFTRADSGARAVVLDVAQAGPAARAGIVTGDRVAAEPNTLSNRIRTLYTRSGDTLDLRVEHAGLARHVRLVARPGSPSLSYAIALVFEALRLTLLGVAALLAIRRPERADARALATFFVLLAYALLLGTPWYPDAIRAIVFLTRELALFAAFGMLVRFAALFPHRAERGVRKIIGVVAWTIVGGVALLVAADALALTRGAASLPAWSAGASFAAALALLGGTVVSFAIGYRDANLDERVRGRWLMLSLALGFGGLLIAAGFEFAGASENWAAFFAFATVLMPVGAAYSILRHRLLDIAFVVNRALVFTLVSAIVVASFGTLEFVLGNALVRVGNVTSVALQLALALGLGASLRGLHDRVNRFVNRILFRKRNDALAALRRFVQQAPFFTERRTLAKRTVTTVDLHARVGGSALYFAQRGTYVLWAATLSGAPDTVDANDAAVLALLAAREPQELPLVDSALPGATAYPLTLRGSLIGMLLCAAKLDGESDDPVEREAVVVLAGAVAAADEFLRVRTLLSAVDAHLKTEALDDRLRRARDEAGHFESSR